MCSIDFVLPADVLTVLTHHIKEVLDKGFETQAITLDTSKALDRVLQRILL